MKIFNASGHPIAQNGIEVIGSVPVPNVDLLSPETILALALEVAKAAREAVEEGIPLALPGMTTLSAHVVALIQGLTGYFPRIAWAARVDGKFLWDEKQVTDLHELRTFARSLRIEEEYEEKSKNPRRFQN